MKGTIKLYFNAENIGKVRSRVENPSKELSAQLRTAIQESAAEVINANILDMRAKMIARFQKLGLTVKDAKHAAALANPLQPFFDVVVDLKPFAGGDDDAEDAGETKEPEGEKSADKKDDDSFDE